MRGGVEGGEHHVELAREGRDQVSGVAQELGSLLEASEEQPEVHHGTHLVELDSNLVTTPKLPTPASQRPVEVRVFGCRGP